MSRHRPIHTEICFREIAPSRRNLQRRSQIPSSSAVARMLKGPGETPPRRSASGCARSLCFQSCSVKIDHRPKALTSLPIALETGHTTTGHSDSAAPTNRLLSRSKVANAWIHLQAGGLAVIPLLYIVLGGRKSFSHTKKGPKFKFA